MTLMTQPETSSTSSLVYRAAAATTSSSILQREMNTVVNSETDKGNEKNDTKAARRQRNDRRNLLIHSFVHSFSGGGVGTLGRDGHQSVHSGPLTLISPPPASDFQHDSPAPNSLRRRRAILPLTNYGVIGNATKKEQ